MMKRNKNMLVVLPLLCLLASCAEAPVPHVATPLTLDYTRLGAIKLAVSKLDFINFSPLLARSDAAPVAAFKPQLADAAYRWGLDRLQPMGTQGSAVFKISNATMTRSKLPVQGGVESWFKRSQAEKWIGQITVELRVTDAPNGLSGSASATVTRSTTLPEEASVSEQENAYRRLLLGMMDDLNTQMPASLQQNLNAVVLP